MNRESLIVIAWVFLLSPLVMVWGIPEPQVNYAFEVSLFMRIMLVHGWALGCLFYGLAIEDEAPLILTVPSFAISLYWIIHTIPDIQSYTYNPSWATTSMQTVLFGVFYIISSLSFIGTALLLRGIKNEIYS